MSVAFEALFVYAGTLLFMGGIGFFLVYLDRRERKRGKKPPTDVQ